MILRKTLTWPVIGENEKVSFFFFFSDLQAFKKFLFSIRLELIYNAMLVSGSQQSDLATHIHVPILFQILFPFRVLNIEYGVEFPVLYSRSLLVIFYTVQCY